MADLSPNSSTVHVPVVRTEGEDRYYSYSHLSRFTRCPLSFQLHYVERLPADASVESRFGRVLHGALEESLREHVRAGRADMLDVELAAAAYRRAWTDSDLADHALFGEGLALLERWVEREGVVDPACVLGLEQEFELHLGPVRLRGAMNRVDRIDEDAVRVRDYTSTRLPPRREDVEESLKLAIYDLAARELWPWARRVVLGLDLLRHDLVLTVERSEAQREATRRYILATVAQIERGDREPRPTTLCAHCDHRAQCPAWADARAGKRTHAAAEPADLPAVAREREELAVVLKALGERKDGLDDILRAALAEQGDLRLEGRRYALQTAVRRDYPLAETLAALREAGVPRDHALGQVGAVDAGALKALLADLAQSLPPDALFALRTRLDAVARCSPVTRLISREVRS